MSTLPSSRRPLEDDFAPIPTLDDDFAPAPAAPLVVVPTALAPRDHGTTGPKDHGTHAGIPLALRPDVTGSKAPLVKSGCRVWMTPGVPWGETEETAPMSRGRVNHAVLASLVPGSAAYASPPTLPQDEVSRAMIEQGKAWLLARGLVRPAGSQVALRRHVTASGAEVIHSAAGKPGTLAALPGLRAEVVFAIDLETGTGREIADPPGEEPRWYTDPVLRAKYGLRPTELPMRLDLACPGIDARGSFARVWDYKFHGKPGAFSPARAQLEVHALALKLAWGVDRVEPIGVHIFAEEAVVEERVGTPTPDEDGDNGHRELSGDDFARILAEVRTWAVPPANDPSPVPGPHCTDLDCPAVSACPVTEEAAVQILSAESLVRRPLAGPLTGNDHAAWALLASKLLKAAAEELDAKARVYADEYEGIVIRNEATGETSVYAGLPSTSARPDLEKEGAIEAVRAIAPAAIKQSVTWAEIKRCAGAPGEKAAREALTALGALKVSESMRYQARPAGAYARRGTEGGEP
jgi:hypothetical protein